MEYNDFKTKLNNRVFGEDLNYEILAKVIKNPDRYIGLFRVTNSKTKLIQNLTQSCEIKFGDFLEEVLSHYISEMGYQNLKKEIGQDEEGNPLRADQIFCQGNTIYLIEQKVRDDHDSTKKRGQYSNLIKKIKYLKEIYVGQPIIAAMWFSDSNLQKNKNYYLEQMENNTDDNLVMKLLYGKDLFEQIFDRIDVWEELLSHLRMNKSERSDEVLSVPNFDFSPEIREALLKMKQEDPKLIKKLLSNKEVYIELRKEFFPTGKNLEGLK